MRSRWGTVTLVSDQLGGIDIQLNFFYRARTIFVEQHTDTWIFRIFYRARTILRIFYRARTMLRIFYRARTILRIFYRARTKVVTHSTGEDKKPKPHIEVGAPPKKFRKPGEKNYGKNSQYLDENRTIKKITIYHENYDETCRKQQSLGNQFDKGSQTVVPIR